MSVTTIYGLLYIKPSCLLIINMFNILLLCFYISESGIVCVCMCMCVGVWVYMCACMCVCGCVRLCECESVSVTTIYGLLYIKPSCLLIINMFNILLLCFYISESVIVFI